MKRKIIVVEDDPMSAKFFELTLRRRGNFDVVVTEEVSQVLDLARQGSIALILMDVSLCNSFYKGERVDGIALARLVKEDESSRNIPILLATAHAMKGEREAFLRDSGADGYVLKPVVDPKAFIERVKELMI